MAVIEAPVSADTSQPFVSGLIVERFPDASGTTLLDGLRRELRVWLGGHPRGDDVVTVVAELVQNAMVHGSRLGGIVTIVVTLLDGGRLEVDVRDEGRDRSVPDTPPETPGFGHGLSIVDALCDVWSKKPGGIGGGGWTVRAVLAAASPPLAEPDLDADDVEALLRAYPDWPDGDAGGDVEVTL